MRALILLMGLWATMAQAAPDTPAVCASCHGAAGEGNDALHAPALAGQHAVYLAAQLHAYRSGERGGNAADTQGQGMAGIARSLSDADITRIAKAYAKSPPAPVSVPPHSDIARGEQVFAADCAACHGLNGQGYPQLGTPNLSILSSAQLRAQIHAFQQVWRGHAGSDSIDAQRGEWMRAVAGTIHDPAALDDIQAYLSSR